MGQSLNKQDIIAKAADKLGLSKAKAAEALDLFLSLIQDSVVAGDKVGLYGFGTFEPTERKARTGINPKTKEKIQIAAKKGLKFKPAKAFKDAMKK
jgi:DNA-binding protein HU-beta